MNDEKNIIISKETCAAIISGALMSFLAGFIGTHCYEKLHDNWYYYVLIIIAVVVFFGVIIYLFWNCIRKVKNE